MKRLISMTIFVVSFAFLFAVQAFGVPLGDTSGTASEKEFQLININLVKAGGKPDFEIQLNATATIYIIAGWPEKVYLVSAFGHYNYDSGEVYETIYAGIVGTDQEWLHSEDKVFVFQGVCEQNPWIHRGSSQITKTCQVIHVENNLEVLPGTNMPDVYPLSANYIHGDLRETLVKWEETYPPEDLSDWNPYAGSEGTDKLAIESPTSYQVIPENATGFQLDVKANITPAPQTIDMKWERMEDMGGWIGDIKLPEGSKMWQPFQGPDYAFYGHFPLTIPVSPVFSSNKSELYQVSVKGVGKTGWTAWRRFWIGQPTVNPAFTKAMVKSGSETQQYVHDAMFKKFLEKEKALGTKVARSKLEKRPQKAGIKEPVIFSGHKPQAQVILGTGHKKAFKADEKIPLRVTHDPKQKVVFEFQRYDGKKWVKSNEPLSLSPRTSKDAKTAMTMQDFKIKTSGKWRVRSRVDVQGDRWSKWQTFVVQKPGGKSASVKGKLQPDSTAKGTKALLPAVKKKPSAISKSKKTGVPVIRLAESNQVFTAPAKVAVKTKHDPSYKLIFMLEKKQSNGRYRVVKESRTPEFSITDPGQYRIAAKYNVTGALQSKVVEFTVKARLKTTPSIKQKKVPSVKQKKMPSIKQKVLRQ